MSQWWVMLQATAVHASRAGWHGLKPHSTHQHHAALTAQGLKTTFICVGSVYG